MAIELVTQFRMRQSSVFFSLFLFIVFNSPCFGKTCWDYLKGHDIPPLFLQYGPLAFSLEAPRDVWIRSLHQNAIDLYQGQVTIEGGEFLFRYPVPSNELGWSKKILQVVVSPYDPNQAVVLKKSGELVFVDTFDQKIKSTFKLKPSEVVRIDFTDHETISILSIQESTLNPSAYPWNQRQILRLRLQKLNLKSGVLQSSRSVESFKSPVGFYKSNPLNTALAETEDSRFLLIYSGSVVVVFNLEDLKIILVKEFRNYATDLAVQPESPFLYYINYPSGLYRMNITSGKVTKIASQDMIAKWPSLPSRINFIDSETLEVHAGLDQSRKFSLRPFQEIK